jgi:hypothetical protein
MFASLDLSLAELLLCALAAVAGAVVQGTIGFGYALVVVPALLLVAPAAIPTTPLVVALPMVVALAVTDRRHLDRAGFARLTAGRLPGTALGAWVLAAAGPRVVSGAAGALLLLAVGASVARGVSATSHRTEVLAGFVSGIAGTVGAVGGPYLGLAYADRPGPVLRATVSAAFAVGVVLSLAAIAIAGALDGPAARLGLLLMPATFAGLAIGRRLTGRLDGRLLRPAVNGFAGVAGAFALVRAVV